MWHEGTLTFPPPPSLCSIIVDKMDVDNDGAISLKELSLWVKHARAKNIFREVQNRWKEFDANEDGMISWDEYKNTTYGLFLGITTVTQREVFRSKHNDVLIRSLIGWLQRNLSWLTTTTPGWPNGTRGVSERQTGTETWWPTWKSSLILFIPTAFLTWGTLWCRW